ncbi:MAG: tRNA glutamyl-Q(34) synthetase GluQRS [Lautropia sp.]|nr:tRNA glutamyl-Q(34) synthetase GluQRS [Lautropia sp.]
MLPCPQAIDKHACRPAYIGRFAPSPSGPLHAGSVVAALASYLDARAHDGLWLLRIEDIDPPRVEPGSDIRIRHQLHFLGLHWDAPPWYQSARVDRYQAVFERLHAQGRLYGCGCTRREISEAWRREREYRALLPIDCRTNERHCCETKLHGETQNSACSTFVHSRSPLLYPAHLTPTPESPTESRPHRPVHPQTSPPLAPVSSDETPYLGTCRNGLPPGRQPRAWRFKVPDEQVAFEDRWLGRQQQHPAQDCGDFVLRRADGLWAYQLAVVVDDGEAGVTDIVRGADLLSSTGRQILLQQALGYPRPRYLHLPLLMGDNGQKLSKQNGAPGIDDSGRIDAATILDSAAQALQLRPPATRDPERWLHAATGQWRERFGKR